MPGPATPPSERTSRRGVVVLAAGHGTRMKSGTPKVLHPVLGEPMLAHVLRAAEALEPHKVAIVVGAGRQAVQAWVEAHPPRSDWAFAVQDPPRGTGDAVRVALPALDDCDEIVVLYGDVPALRGETLQALVQARGDAPVSLLVARVDDPAAYGRVLLDDEGRVLRIVEYADATEAERAVDLINVGMMAIDGDFARAGIAKLQAGNAQGELYLTDLLEQATAAGTPGRPCVAADASEIHGVNHRGELSRATETLRGRRNAALMRSGVTMEDPATTWIEATARVAADVVLGGGVELRGATSVASGAHIERGCVLRDTAVGASAHLKPYTVASEAQVGAHTAVGPFAHLRPGTVLGAEVKVGNFVETKKTVLEDGVKASHLSYIGDAHVGAGSNIGAGTITCNYDGVNKHKTVLGERVFIGSDTQLVAPVHLADDVYVGAGSTVTGDAPAGSLVISRVPQRIIEGWTERKRAKMAAEKAARTADKPAGP
jgi:bifunctional UDP-N-acetylglucosamine pyrophosphorylase/glucosamine-1-phosphate N-acetyltransferase